MFSFSCFASIFCHPSPVLRFSIFSSFSLFYPSLLHRPTHLPLLSFYLFFLSTLSLPTPFSSFSQNHLFSLFPLLIFGTISLSLLLCLSSFSPLSSFSFFSQFNLLCRIRCSSVVLSFSSSHHFFLLILLYSISFLILLSLLSSKFHSSYPGKWLML